MLSMDEPNEVNVTELKRDDTILINGGIGIVDGIGYLPLSGRYVVGYTSYDGYHERVVSANTTYLT